MEQNHENFCGNQTVFHKDMQDCLFSPQYAGLLFYMLGVLRTIAILLITFCQEHPQMVHSKFGANLSNHIGGV